MICTCSTPIERNSHGLCPACKANEQKVIDHLHYLRDSISTYIARIIKADDPDEARTNIEALQEASDELARYGGESVDVMDTIRAGKKWASGRVMMNCLKLGIIEEVRAAA